MDLVLREVVILALVYLVTRLVGKRELSSLEPFDVILLVVVGDLVQQGITQSDTSVTGTMVVLSTLALLVVALSYLNLRVPASRRVLDGEPVLLVVDGHALDDNMRRERITMEDLLEQVRQEGLASLSEVRFGVLENSGKISFIKSQSGGGGD
jgi:uncharacterized membrane protein YcaP (DUF421 family)